MNIEVSMASLLHLINMVFCNHGENIIISTYYLSGMVFDKGETELLLLEWVSNQKSRRLCNYVFLVLPRECRLLLDLLFMTNSCLTEDVLEVWR